MLKRLNIDKNEEALHSHVLYLKTVVEDLKAVLVIYRIEISRK